MNEEKRINAGYEIIESCTIGSTELVSVITRKPRTLMSAGIAKTERIISGAVMSMNFLRQGRN